MHNWLSIDLECPLAFPGSSTPAKLIGSPFDQDHDDNEDEVPITNLAGTTRANSASITVGWWHNWRNEVE